MQRRQKDRGSHDAGAGHGGPWAARALLVVGAVTVAMTPATVAGAQQSAAPTPAPLRNAYPLNDARSGVGRSPTGQARAAEARTAARATRPASRPHPGPAAATTEPSPVAPIVLGGLASLLLVAASVLAIRARGALARPRASADSASSTPAAAETTGAFPVRTRAGREPPSDRRAEPRAAGPGAPGGAAPNGRARPGAPPGPRVEPGVEAVAAAVPGSLPEEEHCRIAWWPVESGAHFRAVGRNRAGRRYIAGRSPVVADPRPPQPHGETLEAYQTLVRQLEMRGWTAESDGGPSKGAPWYEQSFRRQRRSAPRPAQRAPGGGR